MSNHCNFSQLSDFTISPLIHPAKQKVWKCLELGSCGNRSLNALAFLFGVISSAGRSGSCASLLSSIFRENRLELLLLYNWVKNVLSITGAGN